MRIFSGIYKNHSFHTSTKFHLRPTMGKVRECIISTIKSRYFLDDKRILDLFAGTGSVGLELMSNGAKEVVFVDKNSIHIKLLSKNIESLKIRNAQTIKAKVEDFLIQNPIKPYDIIFIDPPYNYPNILKIFSLLEKFDYLEKNGLGILECCNPEFKIPNFYNCFKIKKIGKTYLFLFQRKIRQATNK